MAIIIGREIILIHQWCFLFMDHLCLQLSIKYLYEYWDRIWTNWSKDKQFWMAGWAPKPMVDFPTCSFLMKKSLFLTIKQSSESDLGHQTRKPDNFGHRTIRNWTSSAFTWFQRWFWIYLHFLKTINMV